jgi:hypothetical protein
MAKTPQIEFKLIVGESEIYKIIGEAADSRTSVLYTDSIKIISQDAYNARKHLYPDSDVVRGTYYSIDNIVRGLLREARDEFSRENPHVEISFHCRLYLKS